MHRTFYANRYNGGEGKKKISITWLRLARPGMLAIIHSSHPNPTQMGPRRQPHQAKLHISEQEKKNRNLSAQKSRLKPSAQVGPFQDEITLEPCVFSPLMKGNEGTRHKDHHKRSVHYVSNLSKARLTLFGPRLRHSLVYIRQGLNL